jgi:hypothetical protein
MQHKMRQDFEAGRMSADELLSRFATNYEETTRRIGVDRRTVKAKINRELVAEL